MFDLCLISLLFSTCFFLCTAVEFSFSNVDDIIGLWQHQPKNFPVEVAWNTHLSKADTCCAVCSRIELADNVSGLALNMAGVNLVSSDNNDKLVISACALCCSSCVPMFAACRICVYMHMSWIVT